jgi:hypothetical protein
MSFVGFAWWIMNRLGGWGIVCMMLDVYTIGGRLLCRRYRGGGKGLIFVLLFWWLSSLPGYWCYFFCNIY